MSPILNNLSINLISHLFIFIDCHRVTGQLLLERVWKILPSSGEDVELPEVLEVVRAGAQAAVNVDRVLQERRRVEVAT